MIGDIPGDKEGKELQEQILTEISSSKKVLILLHHNADVDAIASAFVFKHYFKNVRIGVHDTISLLGRKLLAILNEEVLIDPSIDDSGTTVVLDTSSPIQLGLQAEALKGAIVIDHHTRSELWQTDLYYCDESASSCAELVYEVFKPLLEKEPKLDRKVALALMAGILTDTGRFRYANANTFKVFHEIMERGGVTLNEVLEILESDDFFSFPQKIAHLKAAQRLTYITANEYVAAFTEVSSFEASVCNSLIMMGSDIAFAGSQYKSEVRLSCRANQAIVQKGIHLGKFIKEIADVYKCEGGGHDGAAGLNGKGDLAEIFSLCKTRIENKLKQLDKK
jgi:nanoRNase/pAp phosphatase (c-di-AMP/oligoRNAs hydrolase)